MGYLAYIVAAIMMLFEETSNLTRDEGIDMFLDKAASVNEFIFYAVLVVVAILIAISFILSLMGRSVEIGAGCGCSSMMLLLLPLARFIVWRLSVGMANNWDAAGPTDEVRFYVYLVLTILLGSG